MSDYTHNDDMADLLHAKEQEILDLSEQIAKMEIRFAFLVSKALRLETELQRVETEYARGV